MYCSQCGQRADGKFCSHCGNPLQGQSGTALATLLAAADFTHLPANWETLARYEVLMRFDEFRDRVERHAKQAKKGLTGEQFLGIYDKLMPTGVPLEKVAGLIQPLYAKMGIGTGKERAGMIDAPIGRVMLRLLCSLARRGQPLRHVKQAEDGCAFEATLPSDLFALAGDLLISLRAQGLQTDVQAATKLPGQVIDWGKSRRALETLFTDLQSDPGLKAA